MAIYLGTINIHGISALYDSLLSEVIAKYLAEDCLVVYVYINLS